MHETKADGSGCVRVGSGYGGHVSRSHTTQTHTGGSNSTPAQPTDRLLMAPNTAVDDIRIANAMRMSPMPIRPLFSTVYVMAEILRKDSVIAAKSMANSRRMTRTSMPTLEA
jgi:hypothetical protein